MRRQLLVIFLFITAVIYAQVPARPTPQRLYNNLSSEYPNFLSSGEASQLEERLEQFSNETSNQICVVIVDDLNGLPASDFATQLGNEWGVGKKNFNNGIVILVKPTGGAGQRDLFIAVGYGLEGAIPDLATKRIRDEEMYPYLKNGENFKALMNAVNRLSQLAKGEINVKDYTRQRSGRGGRPPYLTIIILVVVVLIIRAFFGGGGGGGYTYGRRGRSYGGWGGGWGGGSWGGGSSGGGGGWGGFGGGSFGGGGSGGKW